MIWENQWRDGERPGHRMKRVGFFKVARVLALWGTVGGAATAEPGAVELYAQLPAIVDPQLSPDGTQVAFLGLIDGRYHVVIERISPAFERYALSPADTLGYKWVHWANDQRLVLAAFAAGSRRDFDFAIEETRLFSLGSNGEDLTPLFQRSPRRRDYLPLIQDDVVSWLPNDPNHLLVSVDSDDNRFYEIRRIDVRTGEYREVLSNFKGPHYVSDETGAPRFSVSFDSAGYSSQGDYRNAAGVWDHVTDTSWFADGYRPVEILAGSDLALVIGPDDSGRRVMRRMNLASGEIRETLVADPAFDVDSAVTDLATGKVVGARINGDQQRVVYIDPEYQALQKSIDAALPEMHNLIASTSADRRLVLFRSWRGVGSGAYYLWNRDTKGLDLFADVLPGIREDQLAAIEAMSYRARDGVQIPAYLTLPRGSGKVSLPAIILPNSDLHARSDAGFNFIAQFLASRGYAVLQANYRGSGGYGKVFEELAQEEWGGAVQDDIADGAQWLVDEGIADASRICIVGSSFGGYAAALGLVRYPSLYHCAASINAFLNLRRYMHYNTSFYGGSKYNEEIAASFSSAAAISPFDRAADIRAPLLILHAKDDATVPIGLSKPTFERLRSRDKTAIFVEIESGGHTLRNVDARKAVLRSLDVFLKQFNPP